MSGPELARRLDVSPQSVHEFERNEVSGSIRFETLRRAAEALDCDLEYVLVPRQGLQDSVERRAIQKATRHIEPIAHHSRLESQSVSSEAAEAQVDDLAATLVDRRGLWSEDADR